ncbi:MAG: membrane-bound lytic murein transglycosylase MltF, partial [Gammaproteobacteria bacterium]|nr:membrane-bound lytic murein transglycosylase MltF [Gammaproteobacteria bacterium]
RLEAGDIYCRDSVRFRSFEDDLIDAGGLLEVVAGSSHEEELQKLKVKHADLEWVSQKELQSGELLNLVKEQMIDFTVADSNEAALARRFHPELKVAFDLTGPQQLAWAFPHSQDSSLYNSARTFLEELKASGTLAQLLERYYGHTNRLGFVDTRTFRRHMAQRLPPLLPFFKEAAKQSNLEWRLLAAIGYQESHWNPKAVSPTGVRGIMMLTKGTARQLGIKDRTDPRQSILGGARYVRIVEKKIPQRIPDPDRQWFALAGYNVGFGHLEDARILTQRHGDDPDKWSDVKKHLPLLSQKKYYSTLKRGFARGREPVKYVDNIRGYYELLKWENSQTDNLQKPVSNVLQTTPAAL